MSQRVMYPRRPMWSWRARIIGLVINVVLPTVVFGQTPPFISRSTGADGNLNITAPGTQSNPLYFDPSNSTIVVTQPPHLSTDTVFNFGNVTIASGSWLRMDSRISPGPIYLLATGPVEIDGTLDLSGLEGSPNTNDSAGRVPAPAGAGGYNGGVGGGATPPTDGAPGNGPGGGTPTSEGGTFSGTPYLIPLTGGSGGAGEPGQNCGTYGGGGGGGGGAILIASSVSITVKGTITVDGGSGYSCHSYAGSGSGGAIRLIAPIITIASGATITSASGGYSPGSPGVVRLESYSVSIAGSVNPAPLLPGAPGVTLVPTTSPPSIAVVNINGTPIKANPFSFPDIVLNTSAQIPIVIQAQYVPVGTIPTLLIYSDGESDMSYLAPALKGTLQSSTTTVMIPAPPGNSHGFVKATWQQ